MPTLQAGSGLRRSVSSHLWIAPAGWCGCLWGVPLVARHHSAPAVVLVARWWRYMQDPLCSPLRTDNAAPFSFPLACCTPPSLRRPGVGTPLRSATYDKRSEDTPLLNRSHVGSLVPFAACIFPGAQTASLPSLCPSDPQTKTLRSQLGSLHDMALGDMDRGPGGILSRHRHPRAQLHQAAQAGLPACV